MLNCCNEVKVGPLQFANSWYGSEESGDLGGGALWKLGPAGRGMALAPVTGGCRRLFLAAARWRRRRRRDRIEDGEAVSRESAGCGGGEMTGLEDRRERRRREREGRR
jgi:hypothetical protein